MASPRRLLRAKASGLCTTYIYLSVCLSVCLQGLRQNADCKIEFVFFFLFPAGFDGFDVRKIDDIEYTVEISCYFLTKWRDDRLILHSSIRNPAPDLAEEEQWFPIDLEFVNKVCSSSCKNAILSTQKRAFLI